MSGLAVTILRFGDSAALISPRLSSHVNLMKKDHSVEPSSVVPETNQQLHILVHA
jgi:hypothetical protein